MSLFVGSPSEGNTADPPSRMRVLNGGLSRSHFLSEIRALNDSLANPPHNQDVDTMPRSGGATAGPSAGEEREGVLRPPGRAQPERATPTVRTRRLPSPSHWIRRCRPRLTSSGGPVDIETAPVMDQAVGESNGTTSSSAAASGLWLCGDAAAIAVYQITSTSPARRP